MNFWAVHSDQEFNSPSEPSEKISELRKQRPLRRGQYLFGAVPRHRPETRLSGNIKLMGENSRTARPEISWKDPSSKTTLQDAKRDSRYWISGASRKPAPSPTHSSTGKEILFLDKNDETLRNEERSDRPETTSISSKYGENGYEYRRRNLRPDGKTISATARRKTVPRNSNSPPNCRTKRPGKIIYRLEQKILPAAEKSETTSEITRRTASSCSRNRDSHSTTNPSLWNIRSSWMRTTGELEETGTPRKIYPQ